MSDCNESHSLWMDFKLPSFDPLKNNENTDVCIVGGGIAGLTCAYTLAKAGKRVIVVDKNKIGYGQTARTTAHLTWSLENRYYKLENGRLAAESHAAAIDYIEKIIREEAIDCDFERLPGFLFSPKDDPEGVIEKEFAAINKLGFKVKKMEKAPIPFFDTGPCLQFPQQAKFHILKYISGLLTAIQQLGGKIYSHTQVKEFKDGIPCEAITDHGNTIFAHSIIVATCTPVNDRLLVHTKQYPYRTYAIAAKIPKEELPNGLYWDTENPYHYVRTQKSLDETDFEWIIIGGEDHRTGQDTDCESKYIHLEKWAKERFPIMGKVIYQWSGQVFEAVDTLGFIGKNPLDKNIYIATGDSGNGMTHGTIAGMLLPDLILKKTNPWEKIYDPARKTLSTAGKYIQENINSAAQYKDWLTPGEIKQIEELSPEEGAILRKGLTKIAVYKDENKQIHLLSAVCPHLGGCVRWNPGEKSWDCPCHGSRFDCEGKVIIGPALENLKTIK